jgi:hypothetical protein
MHPSNHRRHVNLNIHPHDAPPLPLLQLTNLLLWLINVNPTTPPIIPTSSTNSPPSTVFFLSAIFLLLLSFTMTDPRTLPTTGPANFHYKFTVLPSLFMQSESTTDDSTFDFVLLLPSLYPRLPSNLVEIRALRPHPTYVPHRRPGLDRAAVEAFCSVHRTPASAGSEYQSLVPGPTWTGRT